MTIPLGEVPNGAVFHVPDSSCEWVCRCPKLVRSGSSAKILVGSEACESLIHTPGVLATDGSRRSIVEMDTLLTELIEE